ncbi:DUF3422 family protein [Rubrimonas cliftonensis]|uniref:Uncharacterized membrane-anchored protein n=1 Tax=Rubrimonas cliftonensis TaxID=89524 RepID=A0A1H4DI20_9RHOB|nr:DUF3422 domain-containing protein [Rubrimonas cliftonensis]SEA72080.1 Uncharacterized membrane-anchored protein [Rubrimonas cliftonensis]
MSRILPPDHPARYPMTNELHARPFPAVAAPCQAIHLAFARDEEAPVDRAAQEAHLIALVDRFGAPRPARAADHYFGEVGRIRLKWERHTEFVSYTLFEDGPTDLPFGLPIDRLAPAEWLAEAPGRVISAIRVHVEPAEGPEEAERALLDRLHRHFVAESLAGAHVGEGQATVFGDFRIHEDGFTRFAVLALPGAGPRRLGRIVQRLMEIETYRALSMLALPMARRISGDLNTVEGALSEIISGIASDRLDDRQTLAQLTRLSAAIEALEAETAYRFAASKAYSALVEQRIEVLKERRAAERQTMAEFMARRYKPAMRTCDAAGRRLNELAGRAARAATLLSTRVNVAVETQNQALLGSMNRRAELQLRLQRTVEGLSIVAISYYAVSLAGYAVKPFAKLLGVTPETATALLVPLVVLGVWGMMRRLRHQLEKEG